MSRDAIDWNFDRICSAQALIADAQNDMLRCLHKGKVVDVVRDRMIQRIHSAADNLSKLKLNHN